MIAAAVLLAGIVVAGFTLFQPKKDDNPSGNLPQNDPASINSPDAPITPPQLSGDTAVSTDDSFVFIDGGTFTMGSPESEAYRDSDELSHTVTVSSFWIDPYEVSQSDYEAIMGENPSHFKGCALPVENVTWYEAIEYCNKKSLASELTPVYVISGTTVIWDRSANGYRLLTETEWEFVCRAGTITPFPTGEFMHIDEANYQGSYPYMVEEHYSMGTIPDGALRSHYYGTNRGTTIRVDSLSPNAYGVYNMNGNVSEWCFDYYAAYDITDTTDPAGAASGSLRVNRGGGYNDFCKHLRSAYRSATNPRCRSESRLPPLPQRRSRRR